MEIFKYSLNPKERRLSTTGAPHRLALVLAALLVLGLSALGCDSRKKREGSAISNLNVNHLQVAALKQHVTTLAGEIGERNPENYKNLQKALGYIKDNVNHLNYRQVEQTYDIQGRSYKNIILRKKGRGPSRELLILGAHYDSAEGTPGADDNASGTAVLLEIAKALEKKTFRHDLELAFFTLEEPPYFRTQLMGSKVYVKGLQKARRKVKLMICLEMLGYYSNQKIQEYPLKLMRLKYPATGDFISIIGKRDYRSPTLKFHKLLKKELNFPLETLIAPIYIHGIDFSDHLNFWEVGLPALMLTDTAFLRNKNYHRASDRPPTLNYTKMSALTSALIRTIKQLDVSL